MVALLSIEDTWEVHLNENEDLTLPRYYSCEGQHDHRHLEGSRLNRAMRGERGKE